MKKLFAYFLQGVLWIAPMAIIVYILFSLFVTIDGWLHINIEQLIGFSIPGLGVLTLFVSLTVLGYLGQTAIVRPVKRLVGNIIKKAPLLNLLYTSFNDLLSAFVGKEKKFNIPVKVLINQENNLWKMGFITKDGLQEIGLEELAAVYFPHSYNFSGELYLVAKDRIQTVDLPSAEAMKFIVSGGVTQFDKIEE